MPYIAGVLTKDPTFYVKDVTSGKVTEYHYECDFDGDGKYGDTYADKYDFFVLVSSASFSCGTAFPGMLKGTNVKIIGEKSAGGASPVTHFTDGSGLTFQTSGSDIVCYKDGTSYKSVEEGVPVDYEIPENIWYDLEKLGAKLNTLKNQ
jgi:C-terminal processing protease CtpA/Prc